MATKCLRWGICGAGKISNDFCSAMSTLPKGEHEVVAVAARKLESAKEFGDKFGAKVTYDSYEALSKDPNVDIVYIGTIHINHVEMSMLMLNAGKHVLCEKPMSLNMKQAKLVLQLAKEKKLYFMEATWSRCFPIYQKIKAEIASGNLGDVELLTAKFAIPIKDVPRLKEKALGGGCLLDIGIYTIQLACMVFDEMPEKITADGVLNEEGVDQGGCIILKYKGGRMASLAYSGRTCVVQNSASIHGTKANIELPDRFWCPEKAVFPSGVVTNEVPEGRQPYNFDNSGGMRYEADHTRRAILEGKLECEAMPHRHSEMVMSISDEVRKQLGVVYDVD
ncbi:trans-1,2-dihydrobenzene-1,2-diol dehydrogenase-like [Pecten maximus]|uniref:trans-1,2-dihydrobenzene-1,2-diol dehydrogenase-like n=1 Tax=Pecten maximus TaxID=6579 RepID=UPI00145826FC|nr:trans-1,2-dihydrobenzene-1,2-diol dehydrogenase-like [Pecten maximus]XP_033757084.1 trans-1,2-dihydrobenzene-1,2-diol dehydrogenase-like [Pecten maximus]XP_033757085.1 trans-1,2-dihydrobenzene-1,2-diol dehydrogenase-like [Pecten maximus]XP_033757086.1 trans-1,2-dihydrobenzene-1,2-diol dehydrogenase-like [Pecten maximus]